LRHRLRAVIDTNLFISGLFGKDTVSARLQKHWINLDFVLVTSIDIIKEINRVFHYPRIQQRFNLQEETLQRFFVSYLKTEVKLIFNLQKGFVYA